MRVNQAGCVLQVEEKRSLSSAPTEQAGSQLMPAVCYSRSSEVGAEQLCPLPKGQPKVGNVRDGLCSLC